MGRSRSRSPPRRERHRSRSRDRDLDRDRRIRERHRSRSLSPRLRMRSPRRRRSRSPRRRSPRRRTRSRDRKGEPSQNALPKFLLDRPPITEKDLEGKTEEEVEMMKLMGFANFDSSKGKHVPGNNVSAVHVIHKRKYRQYMNRKGGFNRPLDFVA